MNVNEPLSPGDQAPEGAPGTDVFVPAVMALGN